MRERCSFFPIFKANANFSWNQTVARECYVTMCHGVSEAMDQLVQVLARTIHDIELRPTILSQVRKRKLFGAVEDIGFPREKNQSQHRIHDLRNDVSVRIVRGSGTDQLQILPRALSEALRCVS